MPLVEFINLNPIRNMATQTKREQELDKNLKDNDRMIAYLDNADFVRVKVSGNVCYHVPHPDVERNHEVSFLEHSHAFSDTFLVPEEFSKSNDLTERYLSYQFYNHMNEFVSVSGIVVSPEGGQN